MNNIPPNPYDYWTQPERAAQTQRSLLWLREHSAPFVASLQPIAEVLVNPPDKIPEDYVQLSPPSNFKQFGFERPALAVYAALNDHVKTMTHGMGYIGVVRSVNYQPYELQGPSLRIAKGDLDDNRPPTEYAPVALAMSAAETLSSNFTVTWLPRLLDE